MLCWVESTQLLLVDLYNLRFVTHRTYSNSLLIHFPSLHFLSSSPAPSSSYVFHSCHFPNIFAIPCFPYHPFLYFATLYLPFPFLPLVSYSTTYIYPFLPCCSHSSQQGYYYWIFPPSYVFGLSLTCHQLPPIPFSCLIYNPLPSLPTYHPVAPWLSTPSFHHHQQTKLSFASQSNAWELVCIGSSLMHCGLGYLIRLSERESLFVCYVRKDRIAYRYKMSLSLYYIQYIFIIKREKGRRWLG